MKLFKFVLLCLFLISPAKADTIYELIKIPNLEIYNIKTENKLRYLNAKQAFTIGIDNNINCFKSSKQDLDKKYKIIEKNLNKYSQNFLKKINLKYIVMCEDLSISGINTAGIPDNVMKTLIVDIKFNDKYFERVLHHEVFHIINDSFKDIFNEQTALINKINKALGNKAFSNFVPNYKDLATIGLYFQNSSLGAKKRIMLEDKVVNFLTRLDENQTEMKPVDSLEFKMFVKKFNQTYQNSLLREQKDLLSNFIVSFSDNGLGLKSFMNDEIGRLKESVTSHITEESTPLNENFKKVKAKLDSYVRRPVDAKMVEEVFYIQDLLAEVKRNAS